MNDNVNKTTVLIADDDEDILELVHQGLSGRGYEIRLARDGSPRLRQRASGSPR